MKPFVIIAGATASGKTALAHQLFEEGLFSGIIAGDSRHFYKELSIGSTKPNAEDAEKYRYHLVDFLEVEKKFSAYQYQKSVEKILAQEERPAIVGGSPFYLESLLNPIPFHEPIAEAVVLEVEKIHKEKGLEHLQDWLKKLDPAYYSEVDLKNKSRLMRALSYCLSFKTPYSEFRKKRKPISNKAMTFILHVSKKRLHERIQKRTKMMIEQGFIEEVRRLKEMGCNMETPAMNSIGYREILLRLEKGDSSLESLAEDVNLRTRGFAKRQTTWFKRFFPAIFLKDPLDEDEKREDWLENLPSLTQSNCCQLKESSLNFKLLLDDNGFNLLKDLIKTHYES